MKLTPFIIALSFLTFSLPLFADEIDLSHSQEAIHAFNQGVDSFNAKDWNTAIDHFNDAISDDSDFADAYYARGVCRYSLQSTDGAVMDLSDAIRLKPELLDARALRGVIYYQGDQWDQALEDFNAVLLKNPHEAQSLLGRGVIRLKQNNIPEAEKDFRVFVKLYPDHPLTPQLRKILASLNGASESSAPEASAPPASGTSNSVVRRGVPQAQALADSLLRQRQDMSDNYTRQVLRGERAQAVGDISTHPGQTATPPPTDNSGVDIVEPQK